MTIMSYISVTINNFESTKQSCITKGTRDVGVTRYVGVLGQAIS